MDLAITEFAEECPKTPDLTYDVRYTDFNNMIYLEARSGEMHVARGVPFTGPLTLEKRAAIMEKLGTLLPHGRPRFGLQDRIELKEMELRAIAPKLLEIPSDSEHHYELEKLVIEANQIASELKILRAVQKQKKHASEEEFFAHLFVGIVEANVVDPEETLHMVYQLMFWWKNNRLVYEKIASALGE